MRSLRGLCVIRSGATPAFPGSNSGEVEGGAVARAEKSSPVMEVAFSRFGTWYEIDSFFEGRFLEQVAAGAFKRTISQRGRQVRVLFNHGFDSTMGSRVLGVPEVIEERAESPVMQVPLLRGVPDLIVDGLRAGAYGSSFMFEVLDERWEYEPARSEFNPDGIPERTITEVRLFEAGPVTWPANPDATAGLRSGTDWYTEQIQQRDRELHEHLSRSFKAFRALHGLDVDDVTPAEPTPVDSAPGDELARHSTGMSRARRERELELDMA